MHTPPIPVQSSVKLPGHELVANREPEENPASTDV